MSERDFCDDLTALMDGNGGYHVAADCDGRVRVFSSRDGKEWSRHVVKPPPHRLEIQPHLAIDGATVYLGTNRIADVADCGLPADIGFYLRSRTLPGGPWSGPMRIGARGEQVRDLKVVGHRVHAIVAAVNEGPLSYILQFGTTLQRIVLPGAKGASLQVGSDGRARIAYSTGDRIVYALVDGDQLVTQKIVASDRTVMQTPALALGPGDQADLVWAQNSNTFGSGCGTGGPTPLDGTYYATDRGGEFVKSRITRNASGGSLVVDPATGRVRVLMSSDSGRWRLLKLRADGTWATSRIAGLDAYEAEMVLDSKRGALVVFGASGDGLTMLTKP